MIDRARAAVHFSDLPPHLLAAIVVDLSVQEPVRLVAVLLPGVEGLHVHEREVLADVVVTGEGKMTEATKQVAPQTARLRLEIDLALTQERIDILPGAAPADLQDPMEMVESRSLDVDVIRFDLQDVGDGVDGVADAVTETDGADGGILADGATDPRQGVGVIEQPGSRAVDFHLPGDVEDQWHRAQGVGKATRAAVLTEDLLDAMLDRNAHVELPQAVAAGFEHADDEIGVLQGNRQIGRSLDLEAGAPGMVQSPRQSSHGFCGVGVEIHQAQQTARQFRA